MKPLHNTADYTREKSYVELLIELQASVESNTLISNEDKMEIEQHIYALQELLWNYSA